MPKARIILVSDQQLEDLQDPDKEVDLSLSSTPNLTTLRKVCERAKAQGARTVILAFDEFWSQYRKGQGGKPRQLMPDTEDYIQRLAKISQTLKSYGLGLELSLLSPLEIGRGYQQKTGESGRWVQYREGYRDPATGRFTVSLWEQRRWTNNKGTIELKRTGVRVFAFREHRVGGTSFYAVDPADIVELKAAPEIEVDESAQPSTHARRLTIRGRGDTQVGPTGSRPGGGELRHARNGLFQPAGAAVSAGAGGAVPRRRRAAERPLRRRNAHPAGLGLRAAITTRASSRSAI